MGRTCSQCGAELNEKAKFCPKCGAPAGENIASTSNETQVNQTKASNEMQFYSQPSQPQKSVKEQFDNLADSIFAKASKKCNQLVRRYFLGFGDIRLISFVLGLLLFSWGKGAQTVARYYGNSSAGMFRMILGVILIFVCIFFVFFSIYMIFTGTTKVDIATQQACDYLKKRAFTKFNLDEDQLKNADPIVTIGPGISPDVLTAGSLVVKTGLIKHNIVSKLFRHFSKDPVEAYRVGIDDNLRYLLLQVNVFAFADDQLIVYSGNIDISTGKIYHENVSEIFYTDINFVDREQFLRKRFSFKRFKHLYFITEILHLAIEGIEKVATIDRRFTDDDVNRSLEAMVNLIREKKMK